MPTWLIAAATAPAAPAAGGGALKTGRAAAGALPDADDPPPPVAGATARRPMLPRPAGAVMAACWAAAAASALACSACGDELDEVTLHVGERRLGRGGGLVDLGLLLGDGVGQLLLAALLGLELGLEPVRVLELGLACESERSKLAPMARAA